MKQNVLNIVVRITNLYALPLVANPVHVKISLNGLKPIAGSKRNGRNGKTLGGSVSFDNATKLYAAHIKVTGESRCIRCTNMLIPFETWTLDHVIPRNAFDARGIKQDNSIDNLAFLCKSCNSEKSAKVPTEFYTVEQLGLIEAIQQTAKTLTVSDYDSYGRIWSRESCNYAAKYRSGFYLERYWTNDRDKDGKRVPRA
jgi:hypothetical protein